MREGALKSRIATENDFDEIAKAYEEWTERDDDASIAMMHGEILIQK